MTIDLSIVIVNYRTAELTIACLRSLAPQIGDLPTVRVIITDNASGDASAEAIADAIQSNGWSGWATVVSLPRNGGFAYGNNRGIERSRGSRYILLLNSDTIAHPGVLRYCYDLMEKRPEVGILSCLLKNADGSMQNAARRFPSPWRLAVSALGLPWSLPGLFGGGNTEDPGWDRVTEHRPVDWVGGAFMFIRGLAIERAGMLDEDFFFYGEDIEFCHRIRRAGYEIYYDPGASITHLGGGSSDPQRLAARMRNVMMWKARYMVQRKCYGPVAPLIVRGFDLVGSGLRWLRLWARGRRGTVEYATQRDVFQLLLRPLGNGGRS